MEIDINQKKITIGEKHNIFIDGQQTYFASKELFSFNSVINLFVNGTGRSRMIIRRTGFWFSTNYEIVRWDNNLLEVKSRSFWSLDYSCQFGPDRYDIYGHNGRKYSIYKNDRQVAWWDKNMVSWFDGDNYKIIADKDCDVDLLISFCLIVDDLSTSDSSSTISIDLGSIGFETKKFDRAWLPKS
jgi:hypothetical protein